MTAELDPTDYDEVLGFYVRGRDETFPLEPSDTGETAEYRADFERFIAQVRRDAAAKALYEVATDLDNYDDYLTVWNRANQIEETR